MLLLVFSFHLGEIASYKQTVKVESKLLLDVIQLTNDEDENIEREKEKGKKTCIRDVPPSLPPPRTSCTFSLVSLSDRHLG